MSSAATKQFVLVTGCSPGGIGFSLAKEFHSKGLHVIATARERSSIAELEALGMTTISLDVNDRENIAAAKEAVEALTGGKLDILVNNAGRNYTMPALDIDLEEARACFETNFFAIIALTQAFTPFLISTKGLIVNIGSLAGVLPYAFGSVYNASKAAVHAYSRTLRLELEPFDVRVLVVVTGGIKSNIARTHRELPEHSLYLPLLPEFERRQKHSQENAMPNEVYAREVVAAAMKPKPPKWLWKGHMAFLVWFARAWVGTWVFDMVLPRMFGLNRLKTMVRSNDENKKKA